jgi:uncharacterized protein
MLAKVTTSGRKDAEPIHDGEVPAKSIDGEVRVPSAWRVLYKDGDRWKPVDSSGPYGTEKDKFNRVTFKPVTANALRLEVTMQPNFSAGLQEWKVR